MRPDDFAPDPDRATLRMENDLLAYEVAYLRRRLAAAEGKQPARRTADPERDREAERDLRWLLRRLNTPPLGWVLRTRSGFRKLWDRWIGNGT